MENPLVYVFMIGAAAASFIYYYLSSEHSSQVSIANVNNSSDCLICGAMSPRVRSITLLCGHIFCRRCIEGWMTDNVTTTRICPVCRGIIRR